MTREERLLAVVHAQSEIAAAGLNASAAVALVAERAVEVTGAQAVTIQLDGGEQVTCGPTPAGGSAELSAPLVRSGAQVGEITAYAKDSGGFQPDAVEMLSLLAGVLAPHTGVAEGRNATDPLTGLGTRQAFNERLELECARQKRESGDLALVYADVDRLKQLNDAHGFQVGDGALRTIAAVLRRWTRAVDGVYRVGGDEFALVLPGASAEAAELLMGRIGVQLLDAHPLSLTLTFGIASASADGAEQMLEAAENSCHAAKLAEHRRAA